jgi:GTP cyclohydrolase I
MTLRGVQAYGTRLMTSALLGQLRDESAARAEFST